MTITVRMVPITEHYDRIMKLFEDNPGEKMDKYKEELFGTSMDMVSSDTYNMIGYGTELLGSYPQFRDLIHDPIGIRDAAKMIAHTRLKSMIEIVQRHQQIQKRTREKLAKKVGGKAT